MISTLRTVRPGLILLLVAFASPMAAGDRPASAAKIDALLQQRLDKDGIPASPLADDAAFLRRVYLDITGRIPTADQAVSFLDDTDPNKRFKLVETLLATPEYGQHFATIWRELIVDRSEDQQRVRQNFSPAFLDWLAAGLNSGRGWDAMVYDMLTAEGEVKKNPAGTFTLANMVNDFPRPELLAGTAGRLFMGLNIRCAQCHNHPYVDDWKQDDFWGVAAFFGQVRDHGLPQNGPSRDPVISEKPNPDAAAETRYGRRMIQNGQIPALAGARIAIPTVTDPTKTAREVETKFFLASTASFKPDEAYRPSFAKWLTAKENPYFARAAMNRLWAQFFARGLINPVDDMGPNQEPSHPELLEQLAKEFQESGFSHRHMVKLICSTDAYARSSKPLPGNAADRELFSHMPIRVLDPDQTIDSFCVATNRKPPYLQERERQTALFATRDADDPATDFNHGIPQFLYQMNGLTNNLPLPGGVAVMKNVDDAVTRMYLSVLSRRPTPEELKRLRTFAGKSEKPGDAYKDIYWVLFNSAEFIMIR